MRHFDLCFDLHFDWHFGLGSTSGFGEKVSVVARTQARCIASDVKRRRGFLDLTNIHPARIELATFSVLG